MTSRFLSVSFLQGLAETALKNSLGPNIQSAHSKILTAAKAGKYSCSIDVESHLAWETLKELRPTTNAKLSIIRTKQGINEPDSFSILADWSKAPDRS